MVFSEDQSRQCSQCEAVSMYDFFMTILDEDFVLISMQHSRKIKRAFVQQCVGKVNEASHTKSCYDMTSGSSDENSRGTSSTHTLSSTTTILTTSAGTNTGSSKSSTSTSTSSSNNSKGMSKKIGKRPGRKPAKIDERAKLERSRQSAKECRARKKLRYQYLEELVLNREKAVLALRDELELFKQWCIQLDAGGKIPDALLKTIANEDVSRQAHQVEQVKRATQLQQQHEQQHHQHLNFASGASTSSSVTSMHQSVPQSGDVSPSRLPNLSPTQPERHYSGPSLRRQLAFDFDKVAEFSNPSQQQSSLYQNKMPSQQQSTMSSSTLSISESAASSDSHAQYLYSQQKSKAEELSCQANRANPGQQQARSFGLQFQNVHQHQFQNQPHMRPNHPTSETKFSFFQRRNPPVSRIQSEPPMKYIQSLDLFLDSQPPRYSSANQMNAVAAGSYSSVSRPDPNISQGTSTPTAVSRVRSHSNPAFMSKKIQQQVSPTEGGRRVDEIVSSLHARDIGLAEAGIHKIKSFSLPNTLFPTSSSEQSASSSNVGLFSGRPLPIVPSVTPMAVDDNSDSSEENLTEMPLFQSSYGQPQKRALSDPSLNKRSQEVPVSISNMIDSDVIAMQEYNFPKSNMDPQTKLKNLTTVHCLSSTNTLNTPSHSPFMMVPRNTDSPLSLSPAPSSSMGHPNTTPSSSNTPSPAPLLSLTSLLELSSESGVEEPAMDVTSLSTKANTAAMTTGAANRAGSSIMCTETGLSATIAEPIPEWYSFLADLEEGGFIPKQSEPEQPVTPVNKFMNVPNFLDEILGDDKDD